MDPLNVHESAAADTQAFDADINTCSFKLWLSVMPDSTNMLERVNLPRQHYLWVCTASEHPL